MVNRQWQSLFSTLLSCTSLKEEIMEKSSLGMLPMVVAGIGHRNMALKGQAGTKPALDLKMLLPSGKGQICAPLLSQPGVGRANNNSSRPSPTFLSD